MIHPEKLENEIYLGNYVPETLYLCGWLSKRVGNVAYDIYGKVIEKNYHGLMPVFIKKEEVQNRIKDPEYWHSADTYQEMLKESSE